MATSPGIVSTISRKLWSAESSTVRLRYEFAIPEFYRKTTIDALFAMSLDDDALRNFARFHEPSLKQPINCRRVKDLGWRMNCDLTCTIRPVLMLRFSTSCMGM